MTQELPNAEVLQEVPRSLLDQRHLRSSRFGARVYRGGCRSRSPGQLISEA
jgi:hypothetical protein